MMQVLVTSASGANGDGYGKVLGFSSDGSFTGPFRQDYRIVDPRGLSLSPVGDLVYLNSGSDRVLALDLRGEVVLDSGPITRLDPGGGTFGPDGRYYVGSRQRRTVRALPARLDGEGADLLPEGVVPFPRGFGFGTEGQFYLASGVGPDGRGENTLAAFDQEGGLRNAHLVNDTELSPLDLAVAPSGNIVVSSEWPFGDPKAMASVREYDSGTGPLVRVLSPPAAVSFAKPRGLRFGPDNRLYCVGQDHVIVFDFSTGEFLDVVVSLPRLIGQAVVIMPSLHRDSGRAAASCRRC